MLFGRLPQRVQSVVLLALAFAVPLARWLAGAASPWFWLPWLTAPLALKLLRVVLRQEGPPLNPALRDTARLHLFFGVLFAVSLLV